MKITVVGATGQIGHQVVEMLTDAGHRVTAASRSSGVDAISGDGVAKAFDGADVIVDVLNSPSLEPGPALDFFTNSATTLLSAAKTAQVKHYVLLSIVGVDDIEADGYLRGKLVQEELVAAVVARAAAEAPRDGVLNFGGPEKMSFAELARTVFTHHGKDLPVIVDPQATYFGVPVQQNSLVTDDDAERGKTRLVDWLGRR